ncbi:transmembrane protein 273-like isoform X2 [Conger conger]|uniref:transmembrane protein 273-like isoform X2 n=1 Tax=Conger conger TaxID=82655 RepID=UPI002A59B5BC|nr:transmembrane protein 273-like isoform X2 [Conger conger]
MAVNTGLYALLRVILIDCLMNKVHGNDPNIAYEKDFTYALLGVGIGVLLSGCFLATKLCMFRKHMCDNNLSESDSGKRFSIRTITLELTANPRV